MATSFKVLTDGVLDKIKSLGIPDVTEEQADALLKRHVRAATVKFKCCKQDLKDRDDALGAFNVDLSDEEIEILVNFMLVEYLSSNYINVPSLLKQSMTSRDFHVFSAKNHLDGLVALRDTYLHETQQMVSIYSNQGSSLFNNLGGAV
jgi:hypothetical protein